MGNLLTWVDEKDVPTAWIKRPSVKERVKALETSPGRWLVWSIHPVHTYAVDTANLYRKRFGPRLEFRVGAGEAVVYARLVPAGE